jgi:hypothetical protein
MTLYLNRALLLEQEAPTGIQLLTKCRDYFQNFKGNLY